MSAESPRRCRVGGPLVVPPQPPSDRSLMDTVSGFINDVTLTNAPALDAKDVIQWARFHSDIDEPKSEYDADSDLNSLFLVVGYGSGVQVWSLQGAGEAQEVLSWRQGSVRVLRILPTPSKADQFAGKRPLIALCDSAGPGIPFCSLIFISLNGGEQVKSIKFKNPILDVVANRRSIVVSFSERLAVFDACTLDDRLTVTTCYPAPCPLGGSSSINPVGLGDRWLAYAERRLMPTKRSSGGCEGEGVSSYTATVLHAAKSLGKGLRGLGESVASSLGGSRVGALSQSPSPPNSEHLQPGVVTVIDIQGFNAMEEEDQPEEDGSSINGINDNVVAHFVAHSESIIAMKFDSSGMILITADKRGHDFHVFRIHPHPSGSTLASVHHLYILHRGDTTAKVQDISISVDSRWTAISTLRGTTHVFPITPYGGPVGVRTHVTPHVVNRLSRFHRSAGLAADGRSSSPVGENIVNSVWYPNPRLPPFPIACVQPPLSQLRPVPPSSVLPLPLPTHTITRNSSGRQRLSSLSEEGQLPLAVCSRWAAVRAPPAGPPSWAPPRTSNSTTPANTSTHSLFIMSAHGYLLHYYIHPKHISGIPKEKVCDDTNIEVEVEIRAQWLLQRPTTSPDILAPLPPNNILVRPPKLSKAGDKGLLDAEDRWLSQVEIMTHAGPHRRLWMGPQFVFKTYNAVSGTNLSLLDLESVEVGTGPTVVRSNPVNMPSGRPMVPILIESGSGSSLEHSPRMSDAFRKHTISSFGDGDGVNIVMSTSGGNSTMGEGRLKEDLAEAMKDTEQGCEWSMEDWSRKDEVRSSHIHRIVNPLGAVTSGASSSSPSPPSTEDNYIMSNEDEACFRPVVSAPRSLNAPETLPTRPLSSTLLLPVQRVSPESDTPPQSVPPATLSDCVVIPAKLTHTANTFKPSVKSDKEPNFAMNPKPKIQSKDKQSDRTFADISKTDINVVSSKDKNFCKAASVPKEVSPPKEITEVKETPILNKNTKKQKHREKKKEEEKNSPQPIEVKESKKTTEGITKVKDKKFDVAPVAESYVDEISKAVENIEFINNEIVTNNSEPTLGYGRSAFAKSPSPCKVATTCPTVQVCSDNMQDNLDVFDDVPQSPSSLIKEDVNIKEKDESFSSEPPMEVSKTSLKNARSKASDKTAEDAAWELLADIQSATKYEDIVTVEKNPQADYSANDDGKKRKKSSKSSKSQSKSSTKTDAVDTKKKDNIVEVKKEDFVDIKKIENKLEDISSKVIEPVKNLALKPSWSSIAASDSKKKEPEPSEEKPNDNVTDSNVSKVYTRNNIVLAMCDAPTDLCFVDEHHSMFMEPPPLEPIDLVLDEQKIQEISDSLVDYSHSPPPCDISTPNLHFDVNDFANNYAFSESPKTDDADFGYPKKSDEYYSRNKKPVTKEMEDSDDFSSKQCESKLLVLMEKSSDEENVSPGSSQTESDDCTNMAASGVNFIEEEASVVVEEPVALSAPTSSAKALKKKPKRKRR